MEKDFPTFHLEPSLNLNSFHASFMSSIAKKVRLIISFVHCVAFKAHLKSSSMFSRFWQENGPPGLSAAFKVNYIMFTVIPIMMHVINLLSLLFPICVWCDMNAGRAKLCQIQPIWRKFFTLIVHHQQIRSIQVRLVLWQPFKSWVLPGKHYF